MISSTTCTGHIETPSRQYAVRQRHDVLSDKTCNGREDANALIAQRLQELLDGRTLDGGAKHGTR